MIEPGTKLGHYEITGILGAGGMGEVYRALDHSLDREVAIKILPTELISDVDRLERFEREAKVLASLNHPNIVTIHAVETRGDVRFFVMELISGRSLEESLEVGTPGIDQFFEQALAIAEAVGAAHARDITHRDLKPANVMVSGSGWIKVLDFGLAKTFAPPASAATDSPTEGMTQQGVVVGTLPYMSPEQLRGGPIGPASDVFSLGILLYQMATGERPFRGESPIELASAILRDTVQPASELREGLAEGLDAVLARCLEKNPTDRFASANELRDALADLRGKATPIGEGSQGGGRRARGLGLGTPRVPEKTYRAPMVGRDNEARTLRQALERATAGEGSLVALAGEPGVGKSRLAAESIRLARSLDVSAFVGNCYEGEGSRTMSCWADILQAVASVAPQDNLRELLGEGASELAKLYPALRHLFPELPPPLTLPPEAERAYLFDCYRQFLERLCRHQPVLFVLEDLHWADEPTMLLLQHLAPHLEGMAAMVLATYRDAELDVARPLSGALRDLVRERLVERITLRRLNEDGVAELLQALSGRPPTNELVSAIHGETEGNPFFVEEVYQHLEEEGRLFDQEGDWRADLSLEELDVPEGVRLVVGRRLERLADEGRAALTAAGVVGRRFDYALLEILSELEPDPLLDCIEAAEGLRLIEPVAGSTAREVRYQFTHELIRQTLLQGLSLPRRQRLHARVAAALETHLGDDVVEAASSMAHHLYQSGALADEAKTRRFLALAAKQALGSGGFAQALENLEAALSLTSDLEDPEKVELLLQLGAAHRSLGDWEKTLEDWGDALDLCEATGDRARFASIAFDRTFLSGWKGQVIVAMDSARRGLDQIGDLEGAERHQLQALAGMTHGLGVRDYETGDALIAEAVHGAEALGDPTLLAQVSKMRQYNDYFSMRSRQALASGEAAIAAFEATGDLWNLVEARGLLRLGRVFMGQPVMGVSENLALAQRLGNWGAQWWERDSEADAIWMLTGDLERTEEALDHQAEVARTAGMGWWPIVEGARALVRFWSGDLEAARTVATNAVEHEPRGAMRGNQSATLFLIDCYLGRKEEALARLDGGLLPSGSQAQGSGAWTMVVSGVEGLVVLGERERAAELYPWLLRAIETETVVAKFAHRLVQTAAGIGAAAGRLWPEAQEHFETALRQAEEIPFRSEQADVRFWYARMLIERDSGGDTERARMFLDEAIEIYREIGAPGHLERSERLLQGKDDDPSAS